MFLEGWAERYLAWRGRVVLPRAFVGMAIGYSQAVKIEGNSDFNVYRVEVPAFAKPIALNHSMIITMPEGGWESTNDT